LERLLGAGQGHSEYGLLSEKNFDNQIYFGWKRVAFIRGLI
jgi:hypothetical protein